MNVIRRWNIGYLLGVMLMVNNSLVATQLSEQAKLSSLINTEHTSVLEEEIKTAFASRSIDIIACASLSGLIFFAGYFVWCALSTHVVCNP